MPTIDVLAFSTAAAMVLGMISWPLLMLPPAAGVANAAARGALLVMVSLVLGGMAVMFAAVATVILTLILMLVRPGWPAANRLGWAATLLVVTLTWFVLAGPYLGSNDMVIIGDTIILPDVPWRTLAPVGVLTASVVVVGRWAHWITSRKVPLSAR